MSTKREELIIKITRFAKGELSREELLEDYELDLSDLSIEELRYLKKVKDKIRTDSTYQPGKAETEILKAISQKVTYKKRITTFKF